MNINILKGKNTSDIVYFIEHKDFYYIWCESIFEILKNSNVFSKINPEYIFFSKNDAVNKCKILNNEFYNIEQMWLIGYK